MPSERVSMYRIREVLRLSAAGLTVRQVAAGARLSIGAVSKYLNAARAAGVGWPIPEDWDDAELERRVYGETVSRPSKFVMPSCAAIHQELKRHRHVTLQLLWEEYRAEHGPAAYSYSEFCTQDITVNLPPDGKIVFRPGGPGFVLADGSLSWKFGWARKRRGLLTIEGRRLDARAAPFTGEHFRRRELG